VSFGVNVQLDFGVTPAGVEIDMSESDTKIGRETTETSVAVKLDVHTRFDRQRQGIREAYAEVATSSSVGACCGEAASCCGVSDDTVINTLISTRLGYSSEDLGRVPNGADLGLGCGNPKAIAALRPGEIVLDLGSGAGFDAFLAAHEVGSEGHVIGVDMTPQMLSKARDNAARGRYANVEFRLGEIEHLPVADSSVDVILSNCVINLSPDKPQVFREAWRVLRPGGRLAISDVVATAVLPEEMKRDQQLVAACIGNASLIEEIHGWLAAAGFEAIRIEPKEESREFIRDWAPGRNPQDYVVSATIEAIKPVSV